MSKEWFDKHYAKEVTPAFEIFWKGFYGVPTDYLEVEQDSFWTRKGFAWIGWKFASDGVPPVNKPSVSLNPNANPFKHSKPPPQYKLGIPKNRY